MKAGKPEVIKPGSVFDLSCHRRNQNPGLFGSEPDGSGVSWMKDGRPFEDSRSSKVRTTGTVIGCCLATMFFEFLVVHDTTTRRGTASVTFQKHCNCSSMH